MGRAMLDICIVFAQLERETIQKRVTDAYYSRSQWGFKMGGKTLYGSTLSLSKWTVSTEASGKPGGSSEYPAHVRDVRRADDFIRGHYPVLYRVGVFVQWQRTDTPYAGAGVTQSRLCAGRPRHVQVFKKPGGGHCQ